MSIADEPLSHREWCIAFVHGFMGVANMDFEGYDVQPKVGDLVLLRSAPPSLWSISYIVDYRPNATGDVAQGQPASPITRKR